MVFLISIFKGSYPRMFPVLCPNPIYELPALLDPPLIKSEHLGKSVVFSKPSEWNQYVNLSEVPMK